jgi:outer membrane protein OmpA-like peptidoglycan-associated protein
MSPSGSFQRHAFLAALLVAVSLFLHVSAAAQNDETPKIDVFAGYQWLNPGGTVPTFAAPIGTKLPTMPNGMGATVTYNFSKYVGLSLDGGGNWQDIGHETTLSIGPRVMWRSEGVHLFAHSLLGLNSLKPGSLTTRNGLGAILGGGMDIQPWQRVGFRVFEADWVWASQNFADVVPATLPELRRPKLDGARLRAGLIFNFGGAPPEPLTASCSVQPSEVMVGEPITATATVANANPKHTLAYDWSSNGGKVTAKDSAASIDTNGVAGGSYTVTAHVTDHKMKHGGEVSCSANFTVKEPPKNPPTLSLSASPTSVQTGGTVNLSASCSSPDSVPVNVTNWTASAGTISGIGNSATLSTAGAPAGSVTVNATCSDSRGLNTSASTEVTVEAPPPPPPAVSPEVRRLEARLALHSVYFPTAKPSPTNPSGGLLPSQQQTLLTLASDFQKYLQAKPDAHLILEGHADQRGSAAYNQALSERRVARVKSFLVEHGIPEASIETKAFGDQHNLTADEVKDSVNENPELTQEERQRVLRNMRIIILASNRRVDVTLSTTGQQSVRQFPFNAADSLSLIGGREAAKKPAKAAPKARKRK